MKKDFDALVKLKFAKEIETISAELHSERQARMNDLISRNIRGGPTIAAYQSTEVAGIDRITRAQYRILKETHIDTGGTLTAEVLRKFGKRSEATLENAVERIHQRTIEKFPDVKDIAASTKSGLESQVHSIQSRFRRDVEIEVRELSLKPASAKEERKTTNADGKNQPLKSWIKKIGGITVLVPVLGLAGLYYGMFSPDLRLSYTQDPNAGMQWLDYRLEPNTLPITADSKMKALISFRVAFTNTWVKTGWVKDVELVPLGSYGDFIDAHVIAVDRVPISWRQTKVVNMRAEITMKGHFKLISVVPSHKPGEKPTVKLDQDRTTLDLEIRASDNLGRSITQFEDDKVQAGRIHMKVEFDNSKVPSK